MLAPLALAVLGSAVTAQRLVLPDNHNFMEASTYSSSLGDTNQWANAGRRFQVLYEASHFTGKAGVAGPVLITHVRFRGEDGEANQGGQIYSNVQIQLGATSLNAATMVTTFGSPVGPTPGTAGSNRDPAVTTLGTDGTVPSLTVAASVGSCPNNYCIDIDLMAVGAAFVFDPTGPRPNLLIDVLVPAAPVNTIPGGFLIPMQDTVAHGAGIRGRAIWTGTIAALTGSSDTTPPIVGIEFAGAGGWPTELPARAEYTGAACGGSPSTFYQAFSQDQAFDLGAGLTLVPDVYPAPNFYTVTSGAAPFDVTRLNAVPNSTLDEAVVTFPLGYSFDYPGGSTATIKPSTNGFLWLDPAMTSASFAVGTGLLRGVPAALTARFCPFWADLDASRNTGMGTLAGLHIQNDTSGGPGNTVTYVTWRDTSSFRYPTGSPSVFGHGVWNIQCVLHEATGIVEYRYGSMMPFVSTHTGTWTDGNCAAIVGFSRGRIGVTPSVDPGSRNLSHEVPFSTSIEGASGNALLTGVATPIAGSIFQTGRMFGGQTLRYNIANIPAGSILAWTILDVGVSEPSIQLPPFLGITAPGCGISTSLNPILLPHEQFLLPGSSVTGVVPLPIPHGWEGTIITAQAIGIDVFGGPYLIPWSSNAIKYTVGLD
ncbi:MAG: hypothetical protein KF830_04090 [Planctomycetes bacterium]|nr:hypothetical protein [Planctomycetota bacterium]